MLWTFPFENALTGTELPEILDYFHQANYYKYYRCDANKTNATF